MSSHATRSWRTGRFSTRRRRACPCELPLDDDKDFVAMEQERKRLLEDPRRNAKEIAALEEEMNRRALVLSRGLFSEERVYADQARIGVAFAPSAFSSDEDMIVFEGNPTEGFMESCDGSAVHVVGIEKRDAKRVGFSVADFRDRLAEFIDSNPEGIPLNELELDGDVEFCEMVEVLFELLQSPQRNTEAIKDQQYAMNNYVHDLALDVLRRDRGYLILQPQGVPVADLPLDDPVFHEMELQRRNLRKEPEKNAARIAELEDKLNGRADELARLLRVRERVFLEEETNGVPLECLPLNEDPVLHGLETRHRKLLRATPRNDVAIRSIEETIVQRVRELAFQYRGWQDEEFHEANKHMAEEWPRICQLYPEGVRDSVVPEKKLPSHVISAPCELGYLAPFIAAMSQYPALIDRLFETKLHPPNGPYTCVFYDSNSIPVRVDIDDRVPVDANMEPKFTRVPKHSWYPLLLEKAYAKFVGGYSRLDQCTPHETLRDLTGCPVTHIPFEEKRAEGLKMGDFRSVNFWRGIHADFSRGDIITAMSTKFVPDGIHPQCCYGVFGIIETAGESSDPADVVVKLHNCYFDAPTYNGPLNREDPRWTAELRKICGFNPTEEEFLYLPVPVFLRNFSSMQRCHINCGDRLSASGEWDKNSCGGNPKFTTFRSNPIYLVENKSTRPVRILAELCHTAPVFYDADGIGHYHQTGLALLQHHESVSVVSGMITNSTHKFVQKGILLDTREVCSRMEVPPRSACILVPYTMKRGCLGKFGLSIYPGNSGVTLMPLSPLHATHSTCEVEVILTPGNREGKRIDFAVSEACDVHLLLRQKKITDPASIKKGDALAEDDVMMMVYDAHTTRLATTGDATSAREHSLVLQLPLSGRYSVLLGCPNRPVTGDCPCSLFIYTPRWVTTRILPPPKGGAPAVVSFVPPPHSIRSAPPQASRNGNGNGATGVASAAVG
ncbi:putative calpain-like cysteine peptidase [Trypanosoma rangeli]|uniref:Putative calpain-like cysteine peptidase n=1 Tax=Trypanosoma rangeli TaxID=5698 RepID=A0A3R7K0G6_TRYRA|nr:putative calpain-like cysteine peptidase [Trypanosoma rangeli]RNE98434.1 putative calpain-like cysteine peptidase [Trypanosoma rangeli]|eukprot:RNE98434.1 putative calpain-like cysteine peptidase [Trypanosoma rangeli]